MDSNRRAGFRFRLDVLISILGLFLLLYLVLLEPSGMLHLSKCQIRANQRPLPAVASPDLDLCSLITVSDQLVLVPLEERTKTCKTIYITAISAVNSLRTQRHFHVLSTVYLSATQ
jgi:hypothetical protein